MVSPALVATNLTKTFGEGALEVVAVHDVDLELARGEVVLMMGPSGSGKTTLLSMLGGMLRPSAGTVVVDGIDLTASRERDLPRLRARHFGFVFQDFNLLGALSAQENVELACNLAGVSGKRAHDRARELLEQFGLSRRLDFVPAKLSGGEQQRVAIARALANDPPLLLADEPTANLDSKIGHDVGRLLRALAHDEGRSVLMVSHDGRLEEVADRVLWLEDGTLKDLERMTVDPVCGMAVTAADGPHYRYDGTTWWFCSAGCREEFAAAPEGFVARASGFEGARERNGQQ
jgi:putative ABC transport system ATP-binding protein